MDEEESNSLDSRQGTMETLLKKLIEKTEALILKTDELTDEVNEIKSERAAFFSKTDFLLSEIDDIKHYVKITERRTFHTEYKVKDAMKIYEDSQYIRMRFKEQPYLLDPQITVGDIVEVMVDEENARMIGERGLVVGELQHLKTIQFDYPRRCNEYDEKNLKKIGIEPSQFRKS